MFRRHLSTLPVLFACLLGCAADRTGLLVEVSSPDLAVPDDVDALRFQVTSEFGAMVDQRFPIDTPWPHSLTVVPPEGERTGSVTVTVTGYLRDAPQVRRVLTTALVAGSTERVLIELTADCRGVACGDGIDCRAGRCADEGDAGTQDAGSLPDGGAPPDDAGVDAGAVADAGPPDAGAFDAGMGDAGFDAGPPDAGPRDAGFDAGPPDAGPRDAGFDAGPPDAGPRDAGFDAGPPDAGPRDAGFDAGPPDAGPRDAGPPPVYTLVINEIDYDQTGTDSAEFVEILNVGTTALNVDNLALILIDGSTMPGSEYGRARLTGTLAPGEYLIVGIAGQVFTVPAGIRRLDFATATSIQNRGTGTPPTPDGVLLWDVTYAVAVDALAYGGPITATVGSTTGIALVSGTATAVVDSTSAVRSLCRMPNGSDTGNDMTDWVTCATPTPGAANVR